VASVARKSRYKDMIGTLLLQAAKQECDTGTLGFQGLTYLRQFTGIMLSHIGFLFGLMPSTMHRIFTSKRGGR